jgi:hypothetical protein
MSVQSDNSSLSPYSAPYNIENRNFLSPVGFKFVINKLRGVDFFCQAANVPKIEMDTAIQPTRFNKVKQPGDEIEYEDLKIRFLVDENMKNWYEVHDWMREMATPFSSKEFGYHRGDRASINKIERAIPEKEDQIMNQWKSDCSLFILSGNYQPVAEFIFIDAFPISLSTLQFDSSVQDIKYFTAEMVMSYNYFDYVIYDAAESTDGSMPPTYHRYVRAKPCGSY